MNDIKETKSKNKAQAKDYRGLKISSLLAVIFSFVGYEFVSVVNSNYYTPNFRSLYTTMLIGSAVLSLICFVICIIAVFKIKKQRYLYVIYSFITFAIMCLELASVALFNAFR